MRILLNGANGHMGRLLRRMIDARPELALAAGVDADPGDSCLSSLEAFTGEADVILDFSHHSATAALLRYAEARALPLVIATTGQSDLERSLIAKLGSRIPIFFSPTMSPAIAMLADMAAQALRMFPEADVEIVERHHNRKLDVPSGTALLLARAMQAARSDSKLLIGRHENGRRDPKEISIHSLRMGNECGTHSIILSTPTQTLTLEHRAEDRALFAEGALRAAAFITGQRPGIYTMQDLIDARP